MVPYPHKLGLHIYDICRYFAAERSKCYILSYEKNPPTDCNIFHFYFRTKYKSPSKTRYNPQRQHKKHRLGRNSHRCHSERKQPAPPAGIIIFFFFQDGVAGIIHPLGKGFSGIGSQFVHPRLRIETHHFRLYTRSGFQNQHAGRGTLRRQYSIY